jgi:spermidine synthase
MLGEGDGRFLHRFLCANQFAEVDYVDRSARMLDLARGRLAQAQRSRVRFNLADGRHFVAERNYDLVVTHFFLDCLTSAEVHRLAEKLAASTTTNAIWINSEFSAPASGWRRFRARLWISMLYMAFRLLTGLRVSEIPDYPCALEAAGFQLQSEHTSSAELLSSQLWKKTG